MVSRTIMLHRSIDKFNILYFGSDTFSTQCLKTMLAKSKVVGRLETVVPFNHNQPLTQYSIENKIKWNRAPAHGTDWTDWKISGADFDLAVVVSFGYFLPPNLISRFSRGAINVHPSLLPLYRGSAPIQHAIMNNDSQTGISIMELSPKRFDCGKILSQSVMILNQTLVPRIFYRTLHDQLAIQGGEDLASALDNIDWLRSHSTEQNNDLATQAPKILTNQARISFTDSAEKIYSLFRAFGEKLPLFSTFRTKRVQFISILDPKEFFAKNHVSLPTQAALSGQMIYDVPTELLYVKCRDSWLPISHLKVADKQTVKARDFNNGYCSPGDVYYNLQ